MCGVDTGGTFTDSVVSGAGRLVSAKAPSTPADFAVGMFESLGRCAGKLGIGLDELLERTERLVVGTTVGTNAFLERRGARVGLITTRGFADTLHIMRGVGRTTGLTPHDTMMLETSAKPTPLVSKSLTREVVERVDAGGELVVALDPEEARSAVAELVDAGCDAISICFLWSFQNDRNERLAKETVEAAFPDLYVSCSHEIAPKIGEYERFAATTINAMIGPVTMRFVASIRDRCRREGYDAPPLVMQCSGGVMSSDLVERRAIVTLNSGPAGGVTASARLAEAMGIENVITGDVGGTSFDVGLIREGRIVQSDKTEIGQFEFYIPTVDIKTIGAGGGSVAHVDPKRSVISVGPRSAGADPGPVCYGRGGIQPTLTDAALVLGYLASVSSLQSDGSDGGLEEEEARAALGALGEPLGMSVTETAVGIVRIAESHMADLIRRAVVGAGYDPREFTLFAFGGAGPLHAAGFARELNLSSVVVPMGEIASVWSAYGVAHSEVKHVHEYASVMREPFDLSAVREILGNLEERSRDSFAVEGVAPANVSHSFELGIRYASQLHEVYVDLEDGEPDDAVLQAAVDAFEHKYASIFGAQAGFREAGIEIVDFRLASVAPTGAVDEGETSATVAVVDAHLGRRPALFVGSGEDDYVEADVFAGERLPVGEVVLGPAVIELGGTSVVVPPDYRAERDRLGNYRLAQEEN